jgi:hypothetical protein
MVLKPVDLPVVAIPKLNTTEFLDKVEKYTIIKKFNTVGYFNVTPKV